MAQKNEVIILYKNKSDTPLQTIERFVTMHPEYKDSPLTYAGRLDPMAEGVLVVLSGEKNKEREAYTGLDKDYTFEFILGVSTDSHDMLGKITDTAVDLGQKVTLDQIREKALVYTGTFEQEYPPYSSKVVNGRSLFEYARTGTLGTITLPKHTVTVNKLVITGSRTLSREAFEKENRRAISFVKGDFRQEEILALWDTYFKTQSPETITIYRGEVSCGSGFYVRKLVSDIGRDLGCGAVTTTIIRTRVGEYTATKK